MPQSKRSPDGPADRVPTPDAQPEQTRFQAPSPLDVKLPGGGMLRMLSPDEVVMWNATSDRYIRDYRLTRQNDLILLGALLANVLMLYRAQKDLADEKKAATAQAMISKAADEIRRGEKALGIDKATREKGGQHTVSDYIQRLKKAAYEKGVHLSHRMKAYEQVMMDARWKIRLLRNGDQEDREYHRISDASIVAWLEVELAKLEEADKKWAKEKGAIWVGKL